MHTIVPIKDVASQRVLHAALGKQNQDTFDAAHKAMCADLLHFHDHGDVSLCQDICEKFGFGEDFTAAKASLMKEWFFMFSGKQIKIKDAKGGVKIWGAVEKWSKENFKLEEAEKTPFWMLEKDTVKRKLSLEQILAIIMGLPKRVQKAYDEDNFAGSPEVTMDIVNSVVDLVKTKAAALTDDQKGVTELKADKLLLVVNNDAKPKTAVDAAREGTETTDRIVDQGTGTLERATA